MSKTLSEQELHNLAMNIVGKDLESRGFEFIAINSQLNHHPLYVCVDKNNQRFFVIVKATTIIDVPIPFDVVQMETFKNHARTQNAKVLFAGIGLGSVNDKTVPPNLNEDYLQQYEGLQLLNKGFVLT